MSKKFLTSLDLNQNELQNARLQNLAAPPSSPVKGQAYYNSTTNKVMIYTGAVWQPVGGGEPATANPEMDGTAAVGSSSKYAREDHVHPSDTSKLDTNRFNSTNIGLLAETYAEEHGKVLLSDRNYTEAEKTKLAGIEDGAEVNPTIDSDMSSKSKNPVQNKVIKEYVDGTVAAVEAMSFKGTVGADGDVADLPASHKKGATYMVATAGTYAQHTCEVGDILIARGSSGTTASDWSAVQANLEGAITSITGGNGIKVTGSGNGRTVTLDINGVGTSQTVTTYEIDLRDTNNNLLVTIPLQLAASNAAGLMSAADKTRLDNMVTITDINGQTALYPIDGLSARGPVSLTQEAVGTKHYVYVNLDDGTPLTDVYQTTLSAGDTSCYSGYLASQIAGWRANLASTGEEVLIDCEEVMSGSYEGYLMWSIDSSISDAIVITYTITEQVSNNI